MSIAHSPRKDATFLCHSLELSAYLWARGVRFVGVDSASTPTNPNHMVFRFHDPDELCQRELAAYDRGAQIPAQEYALALKQLKDEILRRILAR
jgi:hypothetical protein